MKKSKPTKRFDYVCPDCGKELKFNVPRLGPQGGFVHKDTSEFECESHPNDFDKGGKSILK